VQTCALPILTAEANKLVICSQEPTTYTEANATYALGEKESPNVGSPTDGVPSGRRVIVSAISDGDVTDTGTATHWALIDTSGERLLAANTLSASQAVTNGNTCTLGEFSITIPGPA